MKKFLVTLTILFTIGAVYTSSLIATAVPLSFVSGITGTGGVDGLERQVGTLSTIATTLFVIFSFLLGSLNYLYSKKTNLVLLFSTCAAISIAFIAESFFYFNNLCLLGFDNCKYIMENHHTSKLSDLNIIATFSMLPVMYYVFLHLAGNLATRFAIFVVLKIRKTD